MPILFPLVVSSLLFGIGVYVVLARRHAVLVLMGVELMLNAVNLNRCPTARSRPCSSWRRAR